MLWMAGVILLSIGLISSYSLVIDYCPKINVTSDNSTNVTLYCSPLNITIPDGNNITYYVTNITNITIMNSSNVNSAPISNLTNLNNNSNIDLVLINGTLYAIPTVKYNKTETDSMYLTKADFDNFKSFTLTEYYKKSDATNNTNLSQINVDIQEIKKYVDNQVLTTFWKFMIVLAVILGLIAIGIGVKSMIG